MPCNSLHSLSCFRKTSISATCKVEKKIIKFLPRVSLWNLTENFVQIHCHSEVKHVGRLTETASPLRAHFTQIVQFVLTFQRPSWNRQHVTQPITTTIQTATPPCAIQYRLTYPAITTATGREKSPYCDSGTGDYQLSSLHHAAGVQRAAHIRRARHTLLQHHAVAVLRCLHPSHPQFSIQKATTFCKTVPNALSIPVK
jgi:hypothetical protein